jgi:hypothetical protein
MKAGRARSKAGNDSPPSPEKGSMLAILLLDEALGRLMDNVLCPFEH